MTVAVETLWTIRTVINGAGMVSSSRSMRQVGSTNDEKNAKLDSTSFMHNILTRAILTRQETERRLNERLLLRALTSQPFRYCCNEVAGVRAPVAC